MKTMRKLFAIVLMLMVGMTVCAQEVVVSMSDFTGGTVSVKEKNGQDVTITVAPDKDYFIEMKDVTVIAVKDPASLTRSDEVTIPVGGVLKLTLVDDEGTPVVDEEGEPVTDPEDKTKARNYQFTVPDGLGAWVSEANFHESDKPVTSGKLTESVSWEVATDETAGTKTLILSGDGVASIGDSKSVATYPWKDFDETITDIVVEEGIEAIGDGILDNCTALQSITLKGQKMVGLGKNKLTDKVTVDVFGRLYNEYKTTEGWSDAEIASSDGQEMTGVAFGEGNSYDVFYSEKAMLVPSVLLAFTVSTIDGSNVKIEEIKDGIIPAKVAVLLLSKQTKDTDFRTSLSDKEGSATSSILAAAGEGGKEVALGEVYLLYNDVFYLSQAGTIPAGGVYLPKPVVKTRSFLTIGDASDGTTGISTTLNDKGQMINDKWYDLNGRRLNAAPTRSGLYIYNGKKVAISRPSTPF